MFSRHDQAPTSTAQTVDSKRACSADTINTARQFHTSYRGPALFRVGLAERPLGVRDSYLADGMGVEAGGGRIIREL